MKTTNHSAPGGPGIPARWTSSAKTGVGTALSNNSHAWFTFNHGIFNEIYYPRIDQACVREMGLIVTDGADFFSEEKRDADSEIHWLSEGVPALRLVNTCRGGRYRIEKEVATNPHRDTVLQHIKFIAQQGALSDYRLYVLLAPHLGIHGNAMALACSATWTKRSVGYVGSSDGWQDLKMHKQLTWDYTRAENGNVAMTAGIDIFKSQGDCALAQGFGNDPDEAARNAIDSLQGGFERAMQAYMAGWQEWMKMHTLLKKNEVSKGDLSQISLAILHTHESKAEPGGFIASLSIPWGFSHGDDQKGGYHLVWSQNMWLDGSPYWDGIQMDETALPALLVDLAYRKKALTKADLAQSWPMVRKAAGYLARNGPISPQDRWEVDPGYSPFTVATEIAALLATDDLAYLNHEVSIANYLREIADVWNSSNERWMYVSETDWCQRFDVKGYYVRIAPKETLAGDGSIFRKDVHVKNVTASNDIRKASHLIIPDALALVRFGLRAADDPCIRDTVKVIDALLSVETPSGPAWPLLTGERAHYELSAGHVGSAKHLLAGLETLANKSGLISEQVWDSHEIPERELYFGRPSGSAMPLVWAHAEYLKLQRSLYDGQVFDLPPQTMQRYLTGKTIPPPMVWRYNQKIRSMTAGKLLRIELMAPAVIHWTADDWKTFQEIKTHDTGLEIHITDLKTKALLEGRQIKFTFFWPKADRWEGEDFLVHITALRSDGIVPAERSVTNEK